MDIDAMMRDIDQKLKELDEEEKRQKEKLKMQNRELMETKKEIEKPIINNISTDNDEAKTIEKPKINVDVDSVIVNENVITDDEFFDDFFGDE